MTAKWIFKDGTKEVPCDSFPYAFRYMYNAFRMGVEGVGPNKTQVPKRSPGEMMRNFTITGPCGTAFQKTFSYSESVQKARTSDLLTPDGTLDSRQFKRQ